MRLQCRYRLFHAMDDVSICCVASETIGVSPCGVCQKFVRHVLLLLSADAEINNPPGGSQGL